LGRLASQLRRKPKYLVTAFPPEHTWPGYEWLGRLETWSRCGCSPERPDVYVLK
jgi:hypothetical protein